MDFYSAKAKFIWDVYLRTDQISAGIHVNNETYPIKMQIIYRIFIVNDIVIFS